MAMVDGHSGVFNEQILHWVGGVDGRGQTGPLENWGWCDDP